MARKHKESQISLAEGVSHGPYPDNGMLSQYFGHSSAIDEAFNKGRLSKQSYEKLMVGLGMLLAEGMEESAVNECEAMFADSSEISYGSDVIHVDFTAKRRLQ